MSEALAIYRELAARGEVAFLQAVRVPVLLIEPFFASAEVGIETVSPGMLELVGEQRIARVEKRAGANVFLAMVTVGRATNNDIVIDAEGVSKFHAFFFAGGTDRPTALVDAGSTYGTFVSGQQLVPRERRMVSDGEAVQLASVKTTYLSPAALFKRLARAR